ncbi:alpha/beta hydrolase [Demequina flava]|uniref:alpha/beta hydrolase n=1 Tax=Demequina flava TaxID=1095025 RepID=UPI00078215EC|nr:alpha/beta hydrolase [Demequina flava]
MTASLAPPWRVWTERGIAVLWIAVVVWAFATAWGGIIHSHPAYAVLLILSAVAALAVLIRSLTWQRRTARHGCRRVFRITGAVLAIGWAGLLIWLKPFTAIEPALDAMDSDAAVTVTETATSVTMVPTEQATDTGVLFQPGALVDPRAYAAHLRPLAEAGHTVVVTKQPLGIAFLNTRALDGARAAHAGLTTWAVGGHSLGGVVASMEANGSTDAQGADGLLLFASYPANDMSSSLTAAVESISGTDDGLSTPDAIELSRGNLPASAHFTVIDGASHSQFGDYGPQPGDGVATISDDDARSQISSAALAFVDSLG